MFGGWTAKEDGPRELLEAADREGGAGASPVARDVDVDASPVAASAIVEPAAVAPADAQAVGAAAAMEAAGETYVDFEGKTQPMKPKKWFGIW